MQKIGPDKTSMLSQHIISIIKFLPDAFKFTWQMMAKRKVLAKERPESRPTALSSGYNIIVLMFTELHDWSASIKTADSAHMGTSPGPFLIFAQAGRGLATRRLATECNNCYPLTDRGTPVTGNLGWCCVV